MMALQKLWQAAFVTDKSWDVFAWTMLDETHWQLFFTGPRKFIALSIARHAKNPRVHQAQGWAQAWLRHARLGLSKSCELTFFTSKRFPPSQSQAS